MENKKIKINLKEFNKVKDFISVVRKFESDIDLMTNRAIVDAKSVLGIYALDLSEDTYVRIITDNFEEEKNFETVMEAFK
jgi:phosphotransferase system HPr-like phosphotransfer protein